MLFLGQTLCSLTPPHGPQVFLSELWALRTGSKGVTHHWSSLCPSSLARTDTGLEPHTGRARTLGHTELQPRGEKESITCQSLPDLQNCFPQDCRG